MRHIWITIACLALVTKVAQCVANTHTDVIHLSGDIGPDSVAVVRGYLKDTPPPHFIYIDSLGGSLRSGLSLMHTMLHTPNTTCIARRAMSMGFAIFQTCTNRWVLDSGQLMQHMPFVHNMSGPLPYVVSTVLSAHADYRWIVRVMADRMGVSVDELYDHIERTGDWWMTPSEAVEYNCADRVMQEDADSSMHALKVSPASSANERHPAESNYKTPHEPE